MAVKDHRRLSYTHLGPAQQVGGHGGFCSRIDSKGPCCYNPQDEVTTKSLAKVPNLRKAPGLNADCGPL